MMTKLEVCQEALNDKNRREDDRAKAIAILRRIAEGGEDGERVEPEKIMATLPLSQDEEDAKILAALSYKPPEGACRPDYSPQYRYERELQALCHAVGHPDSCLFLRDRAEPVRHVAILEALAQPTHSQTIRDAAQACIENRRRVWQLE
jgi:hypothetical protein